MGSFGERLREARKQKGLSQTEFGELVGVTKRSQMMYEGDQRVPKADYLAALVKTGIDIEFILTGESRGAAGVINSAPLGSDVPHVPLEGLSLSTGMPVPLYDVEGAAGAGRSLERETVVGTFTIDAATLSQLGLAGAQLAGVRVRGDSMEPTLFDDDWVFIDLNDTNFAQAGVFLVWVSGELRIKRLQRLAGGAMLLISDNSYYEKEMIAPDRMQEVHVMGRVRTRMGEIA